MCEGETVDFNFGACPHCQFRHKPKFGVITCQNCGKKFSGAAVINRISDLPIKKIVVGGVLVGLAAIILGLLVEGL